MAGLRAEKGHNLCGLLVMAVLTAFTAYLVLKDNSLGVIAEEIKKTNAVYLLLGFFLMVSFVGCEASIIRLLMEKSFKRRISWSRSMAYAFTGFYFSAITPSASGGQPMQAYYMKRDGIDLSQSSFVLLVITSFYQIVTAVCGSLMLVLCADLVRQQLPVVKILLAAGILVNGGCAAMILCIVFEQRWAAKLINGILFLLYRLHIVKDRKEAEKKANKSIEEYKRGGGYLKKNPLLSVWVFLITLVQLSCLYLIPWCVSMAMGFRAQSLFGFYSRQSLLSLSVSAVPLPGSVGASEGVFMMLYQNIFPTGSMIPLLLLSRGISFYSFLLLSGGIVLLLRFWKKIPDHFARN